MIFFANTALVGAALIRLRGGDPTMRDRLEIAARNFISILGYALIAATIGIGAVTALVIFGIILLGGGAIYGVFALDLSAVWIVMLGAIIALVLVFVGLVSSTLNSIYTAAVYEYATTGNAGEFFQPELVENAFRLKK